MYEYSKRTGKACLFCFLFYPLENPGQHYHYQIMQKFQYRFGGSL